MKGKDWFCAKLQPFEDSNKMQKIDPIWYQTDYSSSTARQKGDLCEKVKKFSFDCLENARNNQRLRFGIQAGYQISTVEK